MFAITKKVKPEADCTWASKTVSVNQLQFIEIEIFVLINKKIFIVDSIIEKISLKLMRLFLVLATNYTIVRKLERNVC